MKKPVDPREKDLKEPKLIIQEDRHETYLSREVLLSIILDDWNDVKSACAQLGHHIINGPRIDFDFRRLTYRIEYENRNYALEKAAYDAAVLHYEEELKAFNAYQTRKQAGEEEALDDQIERLERRLSMLKAQKAEKESK